MGFYPESNIMIGQLLMLICGLLHAHTLGSELTSDYTELLIPGTLWPEGTEISETM